MKKFLLAALLFGASSLSVMAGGSVETSPRPQPRAVVEECGKVPVYGKKGNILYHNFTGGCVPEAVEDGGDKEPVVDEQIEEDIDRPEDKPVEAP